VAEWVREEGEPNGWVKFAQDSPEPEAPAAPPAAAVAGSEGEKPKKKISLSI